MSKHPDDRNDAALVGELSGLVTQPFSRRGFVMTSLMRLTLATTSVEAQVIRTDSEGLEAGEVQIPAGGRTDAGYRAMPRGEGPFPIILVIEEIFGVHDYIKDICRRLPRSATAPSPPNFTPARVTSRP